MACPASAGRRRDFTHDDSRSTSPEHSGVSAHRLVSNPLSSPPVTMQCVTVSLKPYSSSEYINPIISFDFKTKNSKAVSRKAEKPYTLYILYRLSGCVFSRVHCASLHSLGRHTHSPALSLRSRSDLNGNDANVRTITSGSARGPQPPRGT